MSLLKKPFFAVLLSVLLVLGATAASVGVKLSNACGDVTDGFYYGVEYAREKHPAIADEIRALCSVADGLTVIANNYGIKTTELSEQSAALLKTLNSDGQSVAQLSEQYKLFYSTVKALEEQLHTSALSDRHMAQMQDYSAQIADISAAIAGSGYNDTVREFLQSNDRFPASSFAELFGIDYPAYFG